jgi:nucleotide-binding universal stress UspA family protein
VCASRLQARSCHGSQSQVGSTNRKRLAGQIDSESLRELTPKAFAAARVRPTILDVKKVIDRPIAKRLTAKSLLARLRRIVIPTDFSRPSLAAIPYARAVARHFGAELYLLHVVDSTQYASKSLTLPLVSPAELNRPLLKRLKAVASKYEADGKIHVMKPREGRAYKEICAAARQAKVGLIVIATHGYTGLKRALLGSTAERVVQHSPCPVLVVRHQAGGSDEGSARLRRILVPIDFSTCSQLAFDCSVTLARDFGAELRLVHVIDPHSYPFGDEYAALDTTRLIRSARNSAQRELREMAAQAKVQYSVQGRTGSPAKEICSAANKDVDLIVTSTHGRTGLGHVLIGSVAEHVIRYAPCPVLVLPCH